MVQTRQQVKAAKAAPPRLTQCPIEILMKHAFSMLKGARPTYEGKKGCLGAKRADYTKVLKKIYKEGNLDFSKGGDSLLHIVALFWGAKVNVDVLRIDWDDFRRPLQEAALALSPIITHNRKQKAVVLTVYHIHPIDRTSPSSRLRSFQPVLNKAQKLLHLVGYKKEVWHLIGATVGFAPSHQNGNWSSAAILALPEAHPHSTMFCIQGQGCTTSLGERRKMVSRINFLFLTI